jgi:type II secretion system protein H
MRHQSRITIRSTRGFTLTELIVVTVLIGIMAALATPSFIQWIRSADYRSTARHIASILRQAQSNAITTNREYQVVVDATNRRYGMVQSTVPYNTSTITTWPTVTNWSSLLTTDVTTSATTTIQFTPNGLASATGTVNINDTAGHNRYQVTVSQTGRISVTGPF